MATRRRKITRSAVRRVKRRESKNAKLRSLRVRKHSSKRMRVKQKGGLGFGKKDDDFFSIYRVTIPDTQTTTTHGRKEINETIDVIKDVCVLFYNHKNGQFRLFSKTTDGRTIIFDRTIMFKLINALCGFDRESKILDQRYDSYGWEYYYIFDGKDLYVVDTVTSVRDTEMHNRKTKITPKDKQSPSPSAVAKLENISNQKVPIDGTEFTFDKIVDDGEAVTKYQGKTSFFSSDDTKLDSYLDQARKIKGILSQQQGIKEKKKQEEKIEKWKSEQFEAATFAKKPEGIKKAEAEAIRVKAWNDNRQTFSEFEHNFNEDVEASDLALDLLNKEYEESINFPGMKTKLNNPLLKCFEKAFLSKDSKDSREVSTNLKDLEHLKECVMEFRYHMSKRLYAGIHEHYSRLSKILNDLLDKSSDPNIKKAIHQGIVYALDIDSEKRGSYNLVENVDLDDLSPEEQKKYKKKMLILQAYRDADDLKTLVENKEKFETEFKKWDAIYDMISRKLQFLLIDEDLLPPTFKGTTLDYKNFKRFLYDLLSDTHFIIQQQQTQTTDQQPESIQP